MRAEIEEAYGMFDADERVKCIVVTGDGRIFCAGADLDEGFGEGVNGADAERVQDHRDGYVGCFYCCVGDVSQIASRDVRERDWVGHIDKEECANTRNIQRRTRSPSHPSLPQAFHRRAARFRSGHRHHHDAAHEHPHSLCVGEDRLCFLAPWTHHGSVFFLLLAPVDRP